MNSRNRTDLLLNLLIFKKKKKKKTYKFPISNRTQRLTVPPCSFEEQEALTSGGLREDTDLAENRILRGKNFNTIPSSVSLKDR